LAVWTFYVIEGTAVAVSAVPANDGIFSEYFMNPVVFPAVYAYNSREP